MSPILPLSHQGLTALVTPYPRDYCWQHQGWRNLTLV